MGIEGLVAIGNGDFELAVAPSIGRIVRYGPAGGPNTLWLNKPNARTETPFAGWYNWGGEKVWIWPEGDWPLWQVDRFAPPGDPAPTTHRVETDGLTLRMISPVIGAYGMRVVRVIALDAKGSGVTVATRLEKVAPGTQDLPVGIWTVAQIPAAEILVARLVGDRAAPSHESFAGGPWNGVRITGRRALLTRPRDAWAKLGLEADRLAAPIGEHWFSIEVLDKDEPGETREPFRRAQVFSDPDISPFRLVSLPPYVEIEFTSPLKKLALGESISMTQRWTLELPSEKDDLTAGFA